METESTVLSEAYDGSYCRKILNHMILSEINLHEHNKKYRNCVVANLPL
jgi:hypothetical protein